MTLFDKIKAFLRSNEKVKINGLETIDNDNLKNMRLNKQGSQMIVLTMSMHIQVLAQQFPEWNGLFEVSTDHNDDVIVRCLKGFNDNITRKAIPCLWQRKSFIENCILAGVDKIIFLDTVENTFDLLEIDKVDASKLP